MKNNEQSRKFELKTTLIIFILLLRDIRRVILHKHIEIMILTAATSKGNHISVSLNIDSCRLVIQYLGDVNGTNELLQYRTINKGFSNLILESFKKVKCGKCKNRSRYIL